jgi:hypothetical protein
MSVLKDRKLVFHGLRKSAVVFLLEAGATTAEVQAITGQSMHWLSTTRSRSTSGNSQLPPF